jgi:rifampicin phosphotransferase
MRYLTLLQDVLLHDRTLAGEKAFNLGELLCAGLPIPPGFVVSTAAYERFVQANGLQAEIERLAQTIFLTRLATAEYAAHAIRELFEQGALPEEISDTILTAYQNLGGTAVAVRSSATAEDLPGTSFAGQHETFLNVSNPEALFRSLRGCWASLWTARALIYRARQHSAPQTVRMAVIVQQMIPAIASGVLFTCNPVTGAHNEMVINAAFGLGEAIVSGRVSPDVITLDKVSGQVKSVEVAEKLLMTDSTSNNVVEQEIPRELRHQTVLSAEQITRLLQLGKTIEQHFQAPQDIEWAITERQVFVLQARPITTRYPHVVTVHQKALPVPGDDGWDRRTESPTHPYDVWTRTNIGENLPNPVTPLSATLFSALLLLGRMPAKAERALDAPPLPTFVPFQRYYGRLFVNEGFLIHGALQAGIPTSFVDTIWGTSGRGQRSTDDTFHVFRLLRSLPSFVYWVVQQTRKQAKSPKQNSQKVPRLNGEQLYAQIDQWVETFQPQDMHQLDDGVLWNRWIPLWFERVKVLGPSLVNGQLAALACYLLERRVSKWTGKKGQATVLVQALSGVYTAEIGPALWRMAQTLRSLHLDELLQSRPASEALTLLQEQPEAQPFMMELQALLQRHGYRCPNDAELHNPRWGEAPDQVLDLVKSYLFMDDTANPVETEQRRQQERETLTAQIAAQLNPIRRRMFHWLLRQAQNKLRLRDNNRSAISKFYSPMRPLMVEIGRRWAEKGWLATPDDIFFLTLYEIDDILESESWPTPDKDLVTVVSLRRAAFDYWQTIVAPAALGPGGIPLPDPEPTDSFLQGLPASAGRVRGTARLVRSLDEASRLLEEDILVALGTDPGWTPLFPLVSGLVIEIGGQLSHGAIIAREYGIPAVINVPGAMHFIHDGQTIEVDGLSGRVYLNVTG